MNWKHLKILNEYYEQKISSIKQDWLKVPLLNQYNKLDYFNPEYFEEFKNIYESKHFKEFSKIEQFLNEYDLTNTNLDLQQIEILLKINQEKKQIIEKENISRKEISTIYFNNSKTLKKNTKLYNAILQILDIEQLAEDEHDLQYLWILHPKIETQAILLCENDNYIRTKPRNDYLEIWYVGGANTAKLKYAPKNEYPKYYLCDWDNNGLTIYQRIKTRYLPDIQLIHPQKTIKFLKKSDKHWKSKIDNSLFTEKAIELINYLIDNSLWIEEESIKFEIDGMKK